MEDVKAAIKRIVSGDGVDTVLASLLGRQVDEADGQNVEVSLSLLIRLMEWAREMAKEDIDIHKVAEAVYAQCHPEGAKDDAVATAHDYDAIIKIAEKCGGKNLSGSMGKGGPKNRKRKGMKESVKEQPTLAEDWETSEPSSVRIEMDCLEYALAEAGEEKWSEKKAKNVTNAVARHCIGKYGPLTKEGFEKALEYLSESVTEKELTTKTRKKLSASSFVFPKERRYPIHDLAHARNALARVSQFGSTSEKKAVRSAVYGKYPQLKNGDKKKKK